MEECIAGEMNLAGSRGGTCSAIVFWSTGTVAE